MQKNGYEPAALNVNEPVWPAPRFAVVQAGSSVSVAVCGIVSLLVQVITSPTFAWTVDGENAVCSIAAWTVPAPVATEHAPAPAPPSAEAAGADAAGAGLLALPVAVEPPAHAVSARTAVIARAGSSRRDMMSSNAREKSIPVLWHVRSHAPAGFESPSWVAAA